MSQLAPTLELSDKTKMPLVGLGTYENKDNEKDVTELIRKAFDIGYRYIDNAIAYENEEIVGKALKTIFDEGKYKREDIFIVTKIYPNKKYNTVEKIKETLKKLQIEYADLIYIHWSFTCPSKDLEWTHKPVHVMWKEMEELQEKGLTKSIVDLLSYAKIKPVMNQVELNVYNQQERLVDFCKRVNVQLTAYSPLARYKEVQEDPILKSVAKRHNAEISQIMLAFYLKQNIVVIPKTDKQERLQENFDCLKIKLTDDDMKELKSLDQGERTVEPAEKESFAYVPIFD